METEAIVTGLAAVLGSLAGASASIFTTWMTQHSQTLRERSQLEVHRREVLYGEFVSEGYRLTADAFEHSLEKADALVTLYSIFGRIQLIASDEVVAAADDCCRFLIDLYTERNLTLQEIPLTIRNSRHPLRTFTEICRKELDGFAVR